MTKGGAAGSEARRTIRWTQVVCKRVVQEGCCCSYRKLLLRGGNGSTTCRQWASRGSDQGQTAELARRPRPSRSSTECRPFEARDLPSEQRRMRQATKKPYSRQQPCRAQMGSSTADHHGGRTVARSGSEEQHSSRPFQPRDRPRRSRSASGRRLGATRCCVGTGSPAMTGSGARRAGCQHEPARGLPSDEQGTPVVRGPLAHRGCSDALGPQSRSSGAPCGVHSSSSNAS